MAGFRSPPTSTQRIGFAVELLHQEIRALADGTALVEHARLRPWVGRQSAPVPRRRRCANRTTTSWRTRSSSALPMASTSHCFWPLMEGRLRRRDVRRRPPARTCARQPFEDHRPACHLRPAGGESSSASRATAIATARASPAPVGLVARPRPAQRFADRQRPGIRQCRPHLAVQRAELEAAPR